MRRPEAWGSPDPRLSRDASRFLVALSPSLLRCSIIFRKHVEIAIAVVGLALASLAAYTPLRDDSASPAELGRVTNAMTLAEVAEVIGLLADLQGRKISLWIFGNMITAFE